ncbi:hypothetical protein ARMGADRAFT_1086567 [Armillaria gallica]|uniref:Uncharacterized protein n=1 Tax=Armillaria gallica TaxID=47427 RepID=A0A2H3DG03_ARMGA|nr:hypothetical protein ARMGADRAFT_1086567 [Armillaria gallica]
MTVFRSFSSQDLEVQDANIQDFIISVVIKVTSIIGGIIITETAAPGSPTMAIDQVAVVMLVIGRAISIGGVIGGVTSVVSKGALCHWTLVTGPEVNVEEEY